MDYYDRERETETGVMTDLQKLISVAVIFSGIAYLLACVAVGVALDNKWGWGLALADLGLCYLGAMVQFVGSRGAQLLAMVLAAWWVLVLGIAAGVMLLL